MAGDHLSSSRSAQPFRTLKVVTALLVLLISASLFAASPRQRPRPVAGPPPDTSYVAGMPSVDKVKRTIQGGNPSDTVARQVAVFNLLPMVIQQMGLAPNRRYGDTTPQERAYLNQCAAAAYEMTQDFSRSHTPAEVQAFNTAHNRYETGGPFWKNMLNTLFSTQFLAAYAKVNRDANAVYQTHLDQERQQNQPGRQQGDGGGIGLFDPANLFSSSSQSGPNKDQMRCLELGWSKSHCLGGTKTGLGNFAVALGNAMVAFMGVDPGKGAPPPPPHGLLMSGDYKTTNGLDLAFSVGGGLTLTGCGPLAPRPSGLTITPRGNGYLLELGASPKPVQLAFIPGGPIIGPGTMTIDGQVVVRHEIIAHSRRYSDGEIVPGSAYTEDKPIYGPATASCSFSTFQLTPQKYTQDPNSAKWWGASDLAGLPVPAGMRMSGIYAAPGAATPGATGAGSTPVGLRVQFDVNNAVIDCGQAHVKADYSVREANNQVSIAVANDKSPFTLTLQTNGSLSGSGMATVNGRLLAGGNADLGFTFKPVTATCNVGTLPPS